MAELRTGFDYHLAEVHRSVRAEGGTRSHFAACDACGWHGPQRAMSTAADEDALAHDKTENEDSHYPSDISIYGAGS
jgi:hypothetical protein